MNSRTPSLTSSASSHPHSHSRRHSQSQSQSQSHPVYPAQPASAKLALPAWPPPALQRPPGHGLDVPGSTYSISPAPSQPSRHAAASNRSLHDSVSNGSQSSAPHGYIYTRPSPPLMTPSPSILPQTHNRSHAGLSTRSTADPEKQTLQPPAAACITRSTYSESMLNGVYSNKSEHNEDAPHDRILSSLLHLALSGPLLSIALFFYTLFALFYILIATPFRCCLPQASRPRPLVNHIVHRLSGPLGIQRRWAFLQPLNDQFSNEDGTDHTVAPCSANALVRIHLLAPLLSLVLAFAAWIVAAFWALSAMVSDERADGTTSGHALGGSKHAKKGDDGENLARMLVRFWDRWLSVD